MIALTTTSWSIGPLFLVVLIVIAVVLLTRWGRTRSIPRRPRRRHIVTRIVCAALGLAIVIAVGVSTYRDVEAIYAAAPESHTVAVATLAPPSVPEMPKGARTLAIPEGRFLVHWVFMTPAGNPVHVETFDVGWEQRSEWYRRTFRAGGCEIGIQFSLDDVAWRRVGDKVELRSQGLVTFESRGPGWSSSSNGGDAVLRSRYFRQVGWPGAGRSNPLSIVRPVRETLDVLRIVKRVAPDDPLKEVSVDAFQRTNSGLIATLMSERENDFARGAFVHEQPIPGIAMIERFGPVCLLLLAAAILFAQLFVQRPPAFAGMLTLMVLYAAVLDRAVLTVNLSRLSDAHLPVTSRVLAAQNARMTFFYAETASEKYEAIAADKDEPEALRKAVENLDTPVPWGTDSRSRDVSTPFPPPEMEYPETTP